MQENLKGKADGVSVYEVSYILLPTVVTEQVSTEVASLKEAILSLGGTVISDENPILIDLAYLMTKVVGTTRHKCQSGYFGWVKFEMTPEGILGAKKLLDGNDIVLRYLIVKTVRENTLLNGKMMLKKEEKVKKDEVISDDAEPLPELVKDVALEDIDKSIDDLVIA